MNTVASLEYFLPELYLLAGAFVVLVTDLVTRNKKNAGLVALFSLAGAAFLAQPPEVPHPLFDGLFLLDGFTHFFRWIALGTVAAAVLASLACKSLPENAEGEYYTLFLFTAFGLILMSAAANLLMVFLGVEFVSIMSYLLAGFLKRDRKSKEAAVKYLLFGSVTSALMLYGMSILYGMAGALDFETVQAAVSAPGFSKAGLLAMILFLAGLGFKITMVPFHMWAPDVYEGAPTPVAAFLSVGSKALGFAVLLRVAAGLFPAFGTQAGMIYTVLAVLTMTAGNVIAVSQTNIKRLLGYSSIAQAGYILMGLAVFSKLGIQGILFYLAAYAFTNFGAFIAAMAASQSTGSDDTASFAGLARRSPFLAASLTVFLLSLTGIPPLAGFMAKIYVFSAALEANAIGLVVAAALNSAVAAYYYFRVIGIMYLAAPESEARVHCPAPLLLAILIMLAGTLAFGLAPQPLAETVKGAILATSHF